MAGLRSLAPERRQVLSRRAFLAGSTALAVASMALSACAGTTSQSAAGSVHNSGTSSPAAVTTSAGSAAATSGSVSVPTAHITWSNPSGDPTDIAIVKKFFQSFQQKYPSIRVDVQNIPSGFTQKLETTMAGGVAPDIFWMDTLNLGSFASKGVLLPLDSYIDRAHFDLQKLYPALLAGYVYQGKRYALPKDNGSSVMAWNIDAFKEAGVPAPTAEWTWNDFLNAARKLTKRSGTSVARYGFGPPQGFSHIAPWVWQHGGDYFDKSYTKCLLNQTPAIEALQFLSDLVNKERVAPTVDVIQSQGYFPLFENGKVAMQQMWPGNIPMLRVGVKAFNWDVAFLPKGVTRATFVNGAGNAVWSKTKAPEACWVLIQYFESQQGQDFFLASGKGVPSNKAVGAKYTQQKPPPASLHVMIDDLSFGHTVVGPATWNQISNALNKELAYLWDGSRSAKEVCDRLAPEIDTFLGSKH
ncbi:MAG: sugar ABC transporter substrate-binding protein [Chloroflexi bacterium]|nr:sugar ABC transporter substrate-binding protein [Chloroflexota bacterium]